ncbi:hypothetical protein COU59_02210 [Candidatus Pacearchaeota archaeon CG10_big_fil_rev_8_21_14_0_10_34_12]|nr:MAG: hypothetical protein COU59_02210 [Candidatus Pacearchaeota archaeon CG10_big_fil_rev_8_21_14_0_10_34_12]
MENQDKSTEETFFCDKGVGNGCDGHSYKPIEIRFETLINANCEKPFDWYKELGLDKSTASRIRRGLIVPPKWLRIKIAQYFKTDSATIWTNSDLPYLREILKQQRGQENAR